MPWEAYNALLTPATVFALLGFWFGARQMNPGARWHEAAIALGLLFILVSIVDELGISPVDLVWGSEARKFAIYGLAILVAACAGIVTIRTLKTDAEHRTVAVTGLVATAVGLASWAAAFLYASARRPHYWGVSGMDIGEPFTLAVLVLFPLLLVSVYAVHFASAKLAAKLAARRAPANLPDTRQESAQ